MAVPTLVYMDMLVLQMLVCTAQQLAALLQACSGCMHHVPHHPNIHICHICNYYFTLTCLQDTRRPVFLTREPLCTIDFFLCVQSRSTFSSASRADAQDFQVWRTCCEARVSLSLARSLARSLVLLSPVDRLLVTARESD